MLCCVIRQLKIISKYTFSITDHFEQWHLVIMIIKMNELSCSILLWGCFRISVIGQIVVVLVNWDWPINTFPKTGKVKIKRSILYLGYQSKWGRNCSTKPLLNCQLAQILHLVKLNLLYFIWCYYFVLEYI